MNKVLALLISATVLFPSTSNAGVIQGSGKSCKVGAVKTDAKYRYKCISSGVWKKTALPAKTTEKTPAQAATPTVKLEETIPNEVVVSLTLDNITPNSVYLKSRESINKKINSSSYVLDGVTFSVGSSISESQFATEKNTLERVAKLWSNIYQPKNNVQVLFYNYPDISWANTKVKEIHAAASLHSVRSCSINYCGNASAGLLPNGIWLYEQGLGGGSMNSSTSAHEYTHLAQTSYNSQYWSHAPSWLVEGMAQFYGEAVGYGLFDLQGFTRTSMHRQFAKDFELGSSASLRSILEQGNMLMTKSLMERIEKQPSSQSQLGLTYLVGSYATEVLVAVYGHESVEKFLSSFSTSADWQINFKSSFGISKEDFYTKITAYLAEVTKEL